MPHFFAIVVSALLWFSAITAFVVGGGMYFGIALLFGPHRTLPLGRWACRLLLLCAGQRLRVRGSFPPRGDRPRVYMFNHTSLLDTFIAVAVIPEYTAAIGKKEQFRVPLWGWILRRWGAVPIDRHQLADAIESLRKVETQMNDGLALLIAPEGTRSPNGKLGAFKKGPFHVVVRTGAAISPIIINGAYAAKRKGSWILRPGTIDVWLAPIIEPAGDGSTDVEAVRDQTRACFARLIEMPNPS